MLQMQGANSDSAVQNGDSAATRRDEKQGIETGAGGYLHDILPRPINPLQVEVFFPYLQLILWNNYPPFYISVQPPNSFLRLKPE